MPILSTGKFFDAGLTPPPGGAFNFIERSSNVKAYQGVAFDGSAYYVTMDPVGGLGTQMWTLLKYDINWNLVGSRNMGADGAAGHTQINGLYYDSGTDKLYVCANNYNIIPSAPGNGWVFEVSPYDLSVITYHDLGSKLTEAVFPWGGYWWEVNASAHEIRQFNSSWTLVNTHALPDTDPGGEYWQAIFVIDDVFYVNHHDAVANPLRAYEWNGSGFDAVATSVTRPSTECTQGVYFDGTYLYWAERITFSPLVGYVVKTTSSAGLQISGRPFLKARDGFAYQGFTVTGAGGTEPYTYSVQSGSLPSGLSLNSSTGEVSGTPDTPGTSSGIVLRVTDDLGATADLASFSIVVAAAVGVWEELGRQETISDGKLTLSDLNLAGVSAIQILISGIKTGTEDTFIKLRLQSRGVDIVRAYQWGTHVITTSGAEAAFSSASDTSVVLISSTATFGLDEATTAAASGQILIDEPNSTTLHKKMGLLVQDAAPSGNQVRSFGSAVFGGAFQIDGVTIYGSSALTGGKVIVLGLA
jgi:hypothetical protein